MNYTTRAGTRILNEQASRIAIGWEIRHDAAEYALYADIFHARFEGWQGDKILAFQAEARPEWVHVLNLTTGQFALLDWDVLAHAARPVERLLPANP